MESLLTLLKEHVPADQSRQVSFYDLTDALSRRGTKILKILDLGCGTGNSLEYFRTAFPEAAWIGLDIADSPAWDSVNQAAAEFYTYDGLHIPFDDNHFDLVFSRQVFEHVRYPAELLQEVNRVLRPDRCFIGSTSQLEPYHSGSLWNYTPYGFSLLLKDAGFRGIELRPGIDAATLLTRRVFRGAGFFSRWFVKESPVNRTIGLIGRLTRKEHYWINTVKLLFCGQFSFLARKAR